MDNRTKRNKIYGARKIGIPSTGADVGGKAGLAASTSSNRGVSLPTRCSSSPEAATPKERRRYRSMKIDMLEEFQRIQQLPSSNLAALMLQKADELERINDNKPDSKYTRRVWETTYMLLLIGAEVIEKKKDDYIYVLKKTNARLTSELKDAKDELISLKRQVRILKNKISIYESLPRDVHPATIGFDLTTKVAELLDQKLTIFENEMLDNCRGKVYSAPDGKQKKKIEKVLPSSIAIEAAPSKGNGKTAEKTKPKLKKRVPLPKSPKTSAILITIPPECKKTYFKVMKRAKERINLNSIGIDKVRFQWAKTGGLLLELAGPDREKKADKLTYLLNKILSKIGVQVSRPMKRVELIVRDLEDSIKPEEVQCDISRQGDCDIDDVDCGELRMIPNELGTMWVRCPLDAARKILAKGRLRVVQWYSVRVELLRPRPLQCYRCLTFGHVQQQCSTANKDRSQRCYRCGKKGHKAAQCSATTLNCPVCSDFGLPAKHRMGSSACSEIINKRVSSKKSEKPNTNVMQGRAKKAAPPWMKTLSLPRGNESHLSAEQLLSETRDLR